MSSKPDFLSNDVTLFSNGIGHFRRWYEVPKEGKTISIPFKTECIGDVAASLQVFGVAGKGIKQTSPASFTPANSQSTSLRIDQSASLRSLIKQLSGSSVTVKRTSGIITGKLIGLDTASKDLHGVKCEEDFVVVMGDDDGKIIRWSLSQVDNVEFLEDGIRTEINKALRANFQLIKPGSTLVDLSVAPTGDEAVQCNVQYTIPVAAWKMRYAIRQDGKSFSLEGAAIIDNNTDEDWKEFIVSVVTGNPISFSTDIADIVVPQRKMVHLVDRVSMSNVEVHEAMALESALGATRGVSYRSVLGAKASVANYVSEGLESADSSSFEQADHAGVDSKEVGDFCIFTCKEPVTILSRKSAIVPMFTVGLKHAGVVLMYNERHHERRPYRAIKFKNETDFSLNRGKVTIYNEGIFSGEVVLETTKPTENRMLPHCLENGVRITKEQPNVESSITSIKLSKGVSVTESTSVITTNYSVHNKKDEKFKVVLEHFCNNTNSKVDFHGITITEQEKVVSTTSRRIYFDLSPNEKLDFFVVEHKVDLREINFASNFKWLVHNVIDTPLSKNEGLLKAQAIQAKIDESQEKFVEAKEKTESLNNRVTRTRKNLESVKGTDASDKIKGWVQDIDECETEIREIESKILPDLQKKIKKHQKELVDELTLITGSWEKKQKTASKPESETVG